MLYVGAIDEKKSKMSVKEISNYFVYKARKQLGIHLFFARNGSLSVIAMALLYETRDGKENIRYGHHMCSYISDIYPVVRHEATDLTENPDKSERSWLARCINKGWNVLTNRSVLSLLKTDYASGQ